MLIVFFSHSFSIDPGSQQGLKTRQNSKSCSLLVTYFWAESAAAAWVPGVAWNSFRSLFHYMCGFPHFYFINLFTEDVFLSRSKLRFGIVSCASFENWQSWRECFYLILDLRTVHIRRHKFFFRCFNQFPYLKKNQNHRNHFWLNSRLL